MKAVILAGGKGTRLHPYTIAWPKPLMPLGNHLILDVVLRQLKYYGITDIYLAVGHQADIFKRYLGKEKHGLNIQYSYEEKPLGTAGPLAMIDGLFEDDFLVMNGDVLTTLSYRKFIEFHKQSKAVTTIAIYNRPVQIPYGCLKVDDQNNLTNYLEKPILHYNVSMGIYMFSPQVKSYIKPNERLDFPNLINLLLQDNQKIMSYCFEDYWLDIGRKEDYDIAVREFEERISEFLPDQA